MEDPLQFPEHQFRLLVAQVIGAQAGAADVGRPDLRVEDVFIEKILPSGTW